MYEAYAEGGTQVLGLMTKMQRVEREKITSYYDDDEGGPNQEQEEEAEEKGGPVKFDYSTPPH